MARNEIFIGIPPHAVFDLLSDPHTYGDWVVGTRHIRGSDPDWPEHGSAFAHSVGVPPLVIDDHTSVTRVLAPVMLELRANAGPLGAATITFHLQPELNGTRVTMVEDPVERWRALALGPLGHFIVRARNAESLRRLKRLSEGAQPVEVASRGLRKAPTGSGPPDHKPGGEPCRRVASRRGPSAPDSTSTSRKASASRAPARSARRRSPRGP